MLFFQIVRVLLFKNYTATLDYIWNWARIGLGTSQVTSEIIIVYLLLEFAKPLDYNVDDKEEEEEFDNIRDPKADLIYYSNLAPKLTKRTKNASYNLDKSGKVQLITDTQMTTTNGPEDR